MQRCDVTDFRSFSFPYFTPSLLPPSFKNTGVLEMQQNSDNLSGSVRKIIDFYTSCMSSRESITIFIFTSQPFTTDSNLLQTQTQNWRPSVTFSQRSGCSSTGSSPKISNLFNMASHGHQSQNWSCILEGISFHSPFSRY